MLKALTIVRNEYGSDKGKLMGSIKVASQEGAVTLTLTEEQAEEIIAVVGTILLTYSQGIANQMNQALIDGTEHSLLIGDST